jgi:rhodanese-related sulfurtransferase
MFAQRRRSTRTAAAPATTFGHDATVADGPGRSLQELLAEASARIVRLEPYAAFEAVGAGACLVDIRSDVDREREGVVPGALHIPRTVLEWRFAGESGWRNPYIGSSDRQIVLICDHGYSSVFAAAALVDLGYRAADVVGGFDAWRAAGLPTAPGEIHRRVPGEPAGMRPPD